MEEGVYVGGGVILCQECRGLLTPLFFSSQGDYTVEGKAVLPGRIIALLHLSFDNNCPEKSVVSKVRKLSKEHF